MISLSLRSLAGILGVEAIASPQQRFEGVTIDSRKSCIGQLFVALEGASRRYFAQKQVDGLGQ